MKLFYWRPSVKDEKKKQCGYAWTWYFKAVDKATAADIQKFLQGNERFYLPSWKGEFRLGKGYSAGSNEMTVVNDFTYMTLDRDAISYRLNAFANDVGQRKKLIHLSENGTGDIFEVAKNDCNILNVVWQAGNKADYLKDTAVNFCYQARLLSGIQDISTEEFISVLQRWGLNFEEVSGRRMMWI